MKIVKWRRYASFAIGFGFSFACLAYLVTSLNLAEVVTALRNAELRYLVPAFLATTLSYLCRAWRWRYFFRELNNAPRYYDLVRCLFVGFFMNNVLPARMGEFVRAHVGGRHTREGRTEVLASIASERLVDGLTISALFAVLFSISASKGDIEHSQGLFYVAYAFAAVACLTVLMLLLKEKLFSILDRIQAIWSANFIIRLCSIIRRFLTGLEPLLHTANLIRIVPQSLLIWMLELSVYYFVSLAFAEHLSIGGLILFLAAVNFSSLIPAAPAGVGVIEAFTTMALVHVGVNRETALAMVASQHLIQIIVVGIPGTLFFYGTMGGKLKNVEDSEEVGAVQI